MLFFNKSGLRDFTLILELVVFATHWDIIAFDNSKYLRNNWYFYNLVKG